MDNKELVERSCRLLASLRNHIFWGGQYIATYHDSSYMESLLSMQSEIRQFLDVTKTTAVANYVGGNNPSSLSVAYAHMRILANLGMAEYYAARSTMSDAYHSIGYIVGIGKIVDFALNVKKTPAKKRLRWVTLNSSAIDAIKYDAEQEILWVRMHSGKVYEYNDIPDYRYKGLRNADSAGNYYNRYIKA